MKAILKKESNVDYTLILKNPKEYPHSLPLLSRQNCDELFGVIKVKKLAEEFAKNYSIDSKTQANVEYGFKQGFQKAIELNKDKKFTLEQVIEAMSLYTKKIYAMSTVIMMVSEEVKQVAVEIEMEPMNIDEIREQGKGFLHGNTMKPKLDDKGCLILTKIKQ
jgi:hypothetical protein